MAGPTSTAAIGLLVCLLAFALHVAIYSPISPLPLSPPSTPHFPPNNLLQGAEKLGEGELEGPEDVCVDRAGVVYTATRDGWVRRLRPGSNGSWERWVRPGGDALLGLAVSADGGILVCDADRGLLEVGEGGNVVVVASQVNSTRIRFADEAIEAGDGSVYFSDASSKFGFHDWILDYLEARPHGRLLKYDPRTGEVSVVLADLAFPNGVALSSAQDYLVFCETWRYRCSKYWLEGEQKGKTEILIDNLPGAPDNINLAPDGSFWIALLQLRSAWLGLIGGSSIAKRVIAAFPAAVRMSKSSMLKGAVVINVAADGKITRVLDDSNGDVVNFVTSAMELDGHLFLGSLSNNFVGKLPLQ